MILVDSSVWIDHLRATNASLAELIGDKLVLIHPYVVGELAVGSIKDRKEFLGKLSDLPAATVATDSEVLDLIERRSLYGCGIGYLDADLLASVFLTDGARLWTFDRKLHELAEREGCSADLPRRKSH
jgi:predicted nucleic acid-binding protein